MQTVANQFWIVVQAVARLFWLLAKEVVILLFRLTRWVYCHRRQIVTHKATPWVVAGLAAVWSVGQMYRHIYTPSVSKMPEMVVSERNPSTLADEDFQKEYLMLTGLSPSSNASKPLIQSVQKWLHVQHQDGGKSRKGTDCSGFVQNVYQEAYGITLSRSAAQMYQDDVHSIDREDLTEGDLVFFDTFGGGSISHVGVYLDNQRFAHASTSRGVTIDSLTHPYYIEHYYACGRVKAMPFYTIN